MLDRSPGGTRWNPAKDGVDPLHLSRRELIAWVAVLATGWAALALTGYRSRDPDSALHAAIETDLLARPAGSWIAPQWTGLWNNEGLYREHPVGTFVPPVLLAKLGFPVEQAGYALNALYHRIRANHEQAVLFFLVAALYGTERSRREPAWSVVTVASVVGMMLVKGMFAVLVPASCALWLIVSRGRLRRGSSGGGAPHPVPSDRWAWTGIGLSVVAALLVAAAYEQAYRNATAQPFLAVSRMF